MNVGVITHTQHIKLKLQKQKTKQHTLGLAGFDCHLSPTPPVLHMFYATAGQNYSYVRSWKAIQRFLRDKLDLGLTYSV